MVSPPTRTRVALELSHRHSRSTRSVCELILVILDPVLAESLDDYGLPVPRLRWLDRLSEIHQAAPEMAGYERSQLEDQWLAESYNLPNCTCIALCNICVLVVWPNGGHERRLEASEACWKTSTQWNSWASFFKVLGFSPYILGYDPLGPGLIPQTIAFQCLWQRTTRVLAERVGHSFFEPVWLKYPRIQAA